MAVGEPAVLGPIRLAGANRASARIDDGAPTGFKGLFGATAGTILPVLSGSLAVPLLNELGTVHGVLMASISPDRALRGPGPLRLDRVLAADRRRGPGHLAGHL